MKTTIYFLNSCEVFVWPRLFADDFRKSVEDFIINECCKHIIRSYGDKNGFKKRLKKSGVKEEILFQFDSVQTKRKKDDHI